MPAPTLRELIDGVQTEVTGDDALARLSQASKTAADLEALTDALLGYFVDQCRRRGRSWSEISAALGVSKQAAHKRFSPSPPASERYTERAVAVVRRSEEEAHQLGHGFIGTEHLLLALFDSADGLAARVLRALGVTRSRARAQVLKLVKKGDAPTTGSLPLTPRAKAVLEGAATEALGLGHAYVGTEHLLLALYRDRDALGATALAALGADEEDVRERIVAASSR